jgi:hypothetical protein
MWMVAEVSLLINSSFGLFLTFIISECMRVSSTIQSTLYQIPLHRGKIKKVTHSQQQFSKIVDCIFRRVQPFYERVVSDLNP